MAHPNCGSEPFSSVVVMVDCISRLVIEAFYGSDQVVIDVIQPHGCPQSCMPNSVKCLLEVNERLGKGFAGVANLYDTAKTAAIISLQISQLIWLKFSVLLGPVSLLKPMPNLFCMIIIQRTSPYVAEFVKYSCDIGLYSAAYDHFYFF